LGGRSCGDAEAGGFQAPSLLQLPSLLHVILPCSRSIRCLLFSSKHSNDSLALSNNATKCFCLSATLQLYVEEMVHDAELVMDVI
jgi:hypothetical protein